MFVSPLSLRSIFLLEIVGYGPRSAQLEMGDFDNTFIKDLKEQSWSLYGVGMLIILLRL